MDLLGTLKIPQAAAVGLVAVSDASGNVSWQKATAAGIANDTITATQIAPDSVGQSELAPLAVGTPELIDGAVSLPKVGGGVGSRLLYARVIPSYSAGANAFITLFTQSVTHNGKSYTMTCQHSVYVTGASPYGFVMRILRNGSEMTEVANDFAALNTTTPMTAVYNGAAISGAHTWEVRVDTGNNPNVWSAPGNATGLFMIFENY